MAEVKIALFDHCASHCSIWPLGAWSTLVTTEKFAGRQNTCESLEIQARPLVINIYDSHVMSTYTKPDKPHCWSTDWNLIEPEYPAKNTVRPRVTSNFFTCPGWEHKVNTQGISISKDKPFFLPFYLSVKSPKSSFANLAGLFAKQETQQGKSEYIFLFLENTFAFPIILNQ